MAVHRKTIRHFHEPGDCHELTFSCYQQMPLLTNDEWRLLLCESIDRACDRHNFGLIAFVLMPEHVHLLLFPTTTECHIDRLLYATKKPFSARVKRQLEENQSDLLDRLTIRERPGKCRFRFWQEGGGYDRNLSSESAVLASIQYIHSNPVRRGLVDQAREWKWSSCRWYESDRQCVDPELPTIHGLPAEFFVES